MSRTLRNSLIGTTALLTLIQVIPVDHSDPPVGSLVPAPPSALAVLRKSCWDCHSNETKWPFYAQVAPVTWLVTHDVYDGRRNINFTTWSEYWEEDQGVLIREVGEMVFKGKMPPWFYLPMHPSARLSGSEKQLILDWAARNGRR